jgi:hypothetical protein
MPQFTFEGWLSGLVAFIVLLLILSAFAFQGARWIRPFAYVLAVLMIANAVAHTVVTVFGRTVASVPVSRPAPGFYSSPVLVIASVYLLVQLRSGKPGHKKLAARQG